MVAIEHSESLISPCFSLIQASLNSCLIPTPFSFFGPIPTERAAAVQNAFDDILTKGDWNPFIQKQCGKLRKEVWEKLSEKFPVCLNALNTLLDSVVAWLSHDTIVGWAVGAGVRPSHALLIQEASQIVATYSRQVRSTHPHREPSRANVSAVTARKIFSRYHQNQERDVCSTNTLRDVPFLQPSPSFRALCSLLSPHSACLLLRHPI